MVEITEKQMGYRMNFQSDDYVAAPIHRLPPEILSNIFSILKERNFEYPLEYMCNWTVVTFVCHQWRSTALNVPSLWADIVDFKSCRKTERYIELSKNADLRVVYTDKRGLDSLFMVLRHLRRISFLSLKIGDTWGQLKESLSSPAPRLKVFNLHANNHGALLTLPEASPDLRSLDLRSLNISSIPFTFTALTQLTLYDIVGLSPYTFLSALKSFSSHLRMLSLIDVDWETDPRELPTVVLPHLHDLSICLSELGIHLTNNNILFGRISFPDDCNWDCTCFQTTLADLDFYTQFTQKSLHCETLRVFLIQSTFSLESRSTIVRHDRDSIDTYSANLCVTWCQEEPHADVYARVESLIKGCFWKDTVSATFTINWDCYPEEYWIRLLASLSSLQTLEVVFDERSEKDANVNSKRFLDLLSSQDTSSENGLLCPKLTHLMFEIGPVMPDKFAENLQHGLRKRRQLAPGSICIEKISIFALYSTHITKEMESAFEQFNEEVSWHSADDLLFSRDDDEEKSRITEL